MRLLRTSNYFSIANADLTVDETEQPDRSDQEELQEERRLLAFDLMSHELADNRRTIDQQSSFRSLT